MSGDTTQNMTAHTLQQILDRLGAIESRMTSFDTRLQVLEAKAYDIKPIWERALAELVEVNRRLDGLDRRLSVLNQDVLQTRVDQRKLEERVANLDQLRS